MLNVSGKITNKKECDQYFGKTLPDSARFAVANAATRIVYLGLERSTIQLRKSFDLSNNFLTGTQTGRGVLKYTRGIPHHDLNRIEASWGVPEKRGNTDLSFMEDQETGFRHEGMVPGRRAYPRKNEKKGISRNLRRYNIEIRSSRGHAGANRNQRAMFFLRQAYREGYGLPRSKQFLYLKSGEFLNFREGLYQFRTARVTAGHQFPMLNFIYAKDDKHGKRRKATHWMETSKNTITQSDIDRINFEEMEKAFTRDIRRNWRP